MTSEKFWLFPRVAKEATQGKDLQSWSRFVENYLGAKTGCHTIGQNRYFRTKLQRSAQEWQDAHLNYAICHVRFGSGTDISHSGFYVCFTPDNGRDCRCPLTAAFSQQRPFSAIGGAIWGSLLMALDSGATYCEIFI